MDPQSLAFTPQSDIWRLSNALRSFQEVQQEHNERLVQIERRQDEDARMKSVWGSSSPFPGVLSGITQQGAMNQSANDDFTNFDDDQSNSMVRSLHLDNDEEPRRFGAASRANSVRFDESANQGQWAHASKASSEFIPSRTSSGLNGLGGHPLFERTMSHKSDGRHSSAGQSAVSGRANSFGLEASQSASRNSMGTLGLAPGLFILGSVPAIIRCWMNNNFTHEALLYAVICTGSYKSFLDFKLVERLGLSGRIAQDLNGTRRIKIAVYLPEAVPHPGSSHSSSPTLQLPTVTIDFNVIQEEAEQDTIPRLVQIYIGSDVLRAHNANILFSSNSLTMFDDDRNKISIPLVRPENDETFKSLRLTHLSPQASKLHNMSSEMIARESVVQPSAAISACINLPRGDIDLTELGEEGSPSQTSNGRYDERGSPPVAHPNSTVSDSKLHQNREQDARSPELQSIGDVSGIHKTREISDEGLSIPTSSQTNSSAGMWNNWRRESSSIAIHGDWANVSRNGSSTYTRPNRDQGIKVLRPTRQVSRSSVNTAAASPIFNQSRFFDDGKRRRGSTNASINMDTTKSDLKRFVSNDFNKSGQKENVSTSSGSKQMKGTNPIGGASAFVWLNPS